MEFTLNTNKERGHNSERTQNSDDPQERLRRAIERNRARQAQKETAQSTNNFQRNMNSRSSMFDEPQESSNPSWDIPRQNRGTQRASTNHNSQTHETFQERPTLQDRLKMHNRMHMQEQAEFNEQPSPGPKPRSPFRERTTVYGSETENISSQFAKERIRPNAQERRTVATAATESEFTSEVRKTNKLPAKINYDLNKTVTVKKERVSRKPVVDPRKEKIISYLVKGGWVFCGFLLLRLIFAGGGVIDYYSRVSDFNRLSAQFESIKQENDNLQTEIQKIRTDKSLQKKLVRDNLGFIAADEFLLVFPQEKKTSSM